MIERTCVRVIPPWHQSVALAQVGTDEACCGRLIHRRLPAGLKKHRRKERKMKTKLEGSQISTIHNACYNKSGKNLRCIC